MYRILDDHIIQRNPLGFVWEPKTTWVFQPSPKLYRPRARKYQCSYFSVWKPTNEKVWPRFSLVSRGQKTLVRRLDTQSPPHLVSSSSGFVTPLDLSSPPPRSSTSTLDPARAVTRLSLFCSRRPHWASSRFSCHLHSLTHWCWARRREATSECATPLSCILLQIW